ncbi:MAG: protein kinase [Cyanothece sp. SIO2G6]|nr:protein kinase [Cyanothece sp. SIO2G6]
MDGITDGHLARTLSILRFTDHCPLYLKSEPAPIPHPCFQADTVMTDVLGVWADMRYCLNPVCHHPHNPSTVQICQTCGASLLLGDRYHMRHLIGAGGFSRTFLAIDQTTNQPCAVKQCLPPQSGKPRSPNDRLRSTSAFSSDDCQRFRQEVQQLSNLGHHPQIPRLLDAIEQLNAPTPALYLVQEWIDGQSVAAELSQLGPWDEDKGRSLLASLLPVIQFIHEHQVIHRDIKPENIVRAQADGRLVLVDFGAAKKTSPTQMAQTGTVIGSAGYAAPEQTMGQAVFASDIYSLGVTCLHLLTGMHPFDLYSVSQDDWVWSQYVTAPLSPALAAILSRMVCRSMNQRYRTAAAVLTDLNAAPAALATPAQTDESTQRLFAQGLTAWTQRVERSLRHNPLARLLASNASPLPVSMNQPTPPWSAFERSPQYPIVPSPAVSPSVVSSAVDRPSAPSPTDPATDSLTYAQVHTFMYPHGITALAISPDGTLLASGDQQGNIILAHLPSMARWHEFPTHSLWQRGGHRDRITALQFSPDGSSLFSSSADSTIKQWDVWQPGLLQTLTGEGWGISTLTLHPDGALLLSGGTNGAIDLWNVKQGQFIQRLWQHTDAVTQLNIEAVGSKIAGSKIAGSRLWSSGADGQVYGWDLRTAAIVASILAHYNGVLALVCQPQDGILVTSGGDRTLRFWHKDSLRLLRTVEIGLESGTPIALHPNGRVMATAQDETHIQLWQLAIASPHTIQLSAHSQLAQDWTLSSLVFSALGDRLVSSSSDGTLKIWDSGLNCNYSDSHIG